MSLRTTNYTLEHPQFVCNPMYQVASALDINQQGSRLVDTTVPGNRLYQNGDGSFGIREKSLGEVIGEQIIAPAFDAISISFSRIDEQLSRIHGFQILPGVAAEEATQSCSIDGTCGETKRGVRGDIHTQIEGMADVVKGTEGEASFNSQIDPQLSSLWFKEIAHDRVTTVSNRDFLDSLGECFIANLNLQKAFCSLHTHRNVFETLHKLHDHSYSSVYAGQHMWNLKLQSLLTNYSGEAYKSLKNVNVWVQQIENDPSKKEGNLPKIQDAEENAEKAKEELRTSLKEHQVRFENLIKNILVEVESTIKDIPRATNRDLEESTTNEENLEQSTRALSTAMNSAIEFKSCIAKKYFATYSDMEIWKEKIKSSSFDADYPLDYLEEELATIISSLTARMQSQNQDQALINFQMVETRVKRLISDCTHNDSTEWWWLINDTLQQIHMDIFK